MTAGLEQTFLDQRDALLRYLRARGLPLADAEDVLQDVFVKIGAHSGPVGEPRAYLYRVTDNQLLDRRRSAGRRVRRDDDWSNAGTGTDLEADPQPSAEDGLIAREQLSAMVAVIAALPVRTGDIFRRFRLDGLTQKAIAEALDISKSAVEKHLYRAFAALAAARAAFDELPRDATIAASERLKGREDRA